MNYMSKIAEMLGVEMGERFKTRSGENKINDKIFMLTETGMRTDDGLWANDILCDLLTGLFEVVKLPWKPKGAEPVYYVCPDGFVLMETFNPAYSKHLSMYKLGKLYRTREEAEAHIEEDKAYWESIGKELEE